MSEESAQKDRELRERLHRMESLLVEVEAQPDSAGRARTKEIVQVLMEFHGAAIERMLEHLCESENGQTQIDVLAEDELVSSLLLLYGLHPLPLETREQVHRLLLENAVYHQSAEQHGDMATAAVIDDLGRVLISLDAEPNAEQKEHTNNPDAFRLQMNMGGVLLDLRILHHNDNSHGGQ